MVKKSAGVCVVMVVPLLRTNVLLPKKLGL